MLAIVVAMPLSCLVFYQTVLAFGFSVETAYLLAIVGFFTPFAVAAAQK